MTRPPSIFLLAAAKNTVLVTAFAAPLTSLASAQGSFLDLGTISPPGSPSIDESRAYGISNDGRTVVGASIYGETFNLRAVQFRWHATTGMNDLGTAHGADYAAASEVTPDGTVVLGSLSYSVAQSTETSIWESSLGLQRLDSSGALVDTFGMDQSADGDRILLTGSGGGTLLFTRSTGATAAIQPPAGADRFFALACDDAGTSAVGTAENFAVGSGDAAVWREGIGVSLIPNLGPNSIARDISPDGHLVLGEAWPNGSGNRDVWLHNLTTGSTSVFGETTSNNPALDMSADGGVVVFFNGDVWTPATGITTFQTLLAAAGVTPPAGSSAIQTAAVSADGLSFAGSFQTSAGQVHAFAAYLAEPVAQIIGESVCASVVPNSTGVAGQLEARGSVLASDNDVRLVATDLPSNVTTLFLNSPMMGFSSSPGGSQGNLCLGGEIGRYNAAIATSTLDGAADLTLDLLQTPRPTALVEIVFGERWHFQAWHRDANPGSTSNFTDAVVIEFE